MVLDANPPGPRGPLADILNAVQWKKEGVAFLSRIVDTHGDLAWFRLGDYPVYLVQDPALIQKALVDHRENLRKPESLKISNRGYWGDGITSLDGAAWQKRKQALQPVFHHGRVSAWSRIVVDCTQAMLARWSSHTDIRLFDEFVDLRAAIAAQTVLGAHVEDSGKGGVIPRDEARGVSFVLSAENSQTPFVGMRRPRAGPESDAISSLIDRGLAEPANRADVLSYLAGRHPEDGGLPPGEIKDELLQMFFAGHLTVSTWLTRASYVLGTYPEIDGRLHRESCDLLKDDGLDSNAAPPLTYAAQVIKETGRYFAPAPVLYREIETSFTLGGYDLQEDAGLWICPQLLHHDPRHFPKPDIFRPDRFGPEHGPAIHKFAYLPFGAGPRVCIGKAAALMEMQLVLAIINRAFRLVPLGPAPDKTQPLAMPPPTELAMRVEARGQPC